MSHINEKIDNIPVGKIFKGPYKVTYKRKKW